MDHPDAADPHRLKHLITRGLEAAALVAAFICIALIYNGLMLDVSYQRARVLDVIQVPGQDASERLILVDLGHRHFPLRTSDRLLRIEKGKLACVSRRHILLRRWKRYALELPGYCRTLPQIEGSSSHFHPFDPKSDSGMPLISHRPCPTATRTETGALLCAN